MNRGERQSRIYEMRGSVTYQPTDREVQSHIKDFILPYQQQLHDAATIQRAIFVGQLRDVRAAAIRDNGRQPSRIAICAATLENSIQMPIEGLSFDFYGQNNSPEFVFWSDIGQGINLAKVPLVLGEEYIREHAEGIMQKARQEVDEYKGEPLPVSESAEGYILMQKEAKEAAELLIDDPSGLTLVRHTVDLLKQPSQPGRITKIFPSNRINAYVTAGAELAQLAYELMYPLTEGLTS